MRDLALSGWSPWRQKWTEWWVRVDAKAIWVFCSCRVQSVGWWCGVQHSARGVVYAVVERSLAIVNSFNGHCFVELILWRHQWGGVREGKNEWCEGLEEGKNRWWELLGEGGGGGVVAEIGRSQRVHFGTFKVVNCFLGVDGKYAFK